MTGPAARSRAGAVAGALMVLATALACGTGPSSGCPPAAPPDLRTVPGWVGYLVAHPDTVSYVVDDGRGTRLEHRADVVGPMASASKALNMVAYARAVALGLVRADEPVRVGDWERWQVKDSGEDSHANALDHLGIPRTGNYATDPNRTITIDQLANEMIIWSDNAAPDYLRNRLGDRAMYDAARAVGWTGAELPSNAGFTLGLFAPDLVPMAADRATRRAAEWTLARRYAGDPTLRAELDRRPAPSRTSEAAWSDGGPGGTARQLDALWTAVARRTFPGAERARAIGEQLPNPGPGVLKRGLKSGRILGVVASGFELRRDDGTIATVSLIVRHLTDRDGQQVTEAGEALEQLHVAAVDDPAILATLRCATGAEAPAR